jgi:uncharacterized paraquat-inducible protein A
MRLRDYLFLTWLFGNKTRRERMIRGQNDNYLCNGCRSVVDPAAHICRACGSDLFTLKGKMLRGMFATVALVLILIGANPTSSRIYLVPGLIAFAISGYYQFTRPVH